MVLVHFLAAFLAAGLATAYLVAPPGTAFTGTVSDCSGWMNGPTGLTCAEVADAVGITTTEFETWNPLVDDGSTCELTSGFWYCIQVDFESNSSTSTAVASSTTSAATTTSSATTTSTGDGISTPSPIQTGMTSTCDKFHLVVSGDTCSAVASAAGISLTTFYAWNPAVGTGCALLEIGDYVCIDIIGYTPSTTTISTSTTTSSGNGVTTPTPFETGIVSDCNSFHLVSSGDTCTSIADSYGITLADIEAWNADVGSSCTGIWLDYYICVGIL